MEIKCHFYEWGKVWLCRKKSAITNPVCSCIACRHDCVRVCVRAARVLYIHSCMKCASVHSSPGRVLAASPRKVTYSHSHSGLIYTRRSICIFPDDAAVLWVVVTWQPQPHPPHISHHSGIPREVKREFNVLTIWPRFLLTAVTRFGAV